MRILVVNPPYHSLTSLHGVGAQTPLGLLWVGGALIDAGHEVSLLDAEALRLTVSDVTERTAAIRPEIIMTGHAGSTPAHPSVIAMARGLKARLPDVPIVYGGVYPTYHGAEILAAEPSIDVIVRGEGEQTALVKLTEAICICAARAAAHHALCQSRSAARLPLVPATFVAGLVRRDPRVFAGRAP